MARNGLKLSFFSRKFWASVSSISDLIIYLADSGFFKNFQHQSGLKSTVSKVFEDLKFKISEGYEQN
jgi:hypothetical protein